MPRHVTNAPVGHDDGRRAFGREDAADQNCLAPVRRKMFDHVLRKKTRGTATIGSAQGRGTWLRDQAAACAGSCFQSFFMFSSDMPLLSGTNFQTNRAASTLKPPYSQYAKPLWNEAVRAVLPSMMLNVTVTTQFMNHCAATAIAMALSRMEFGKISASITHTTGPQESEKPAM